MDSIEMFKTNEAIKAGLIGLRVVNVYSHSIGTITSIENGFVTVDFHDAPCRYMFPEAFSNTLELEDEDLQESIQNYGAGASFENFKKNYRFAINNEIDYLKTTGGKKIRIVDGERLATKSNDYLYAFDTDTDLRVPDDTAVKLWFPDKIVNGYVVSSEDFTIIIRTAEYVGEFVESVEMSYEQWQLLEALMDRLSEMYPDNNSLAYEIACNGKRQINPLKRIKCGQNQAFNQATSERITFIWGPPGTGKTETLSSIALEYIEDGKRVLMLSYSNVSVDGALLRIARKADLEPGCIIRYGYPRSTELLESNTLTSYKYVLYKNPELGSRYQDLLERKKKTRKKDSARIEINKKLNRIRDNLLEQEKELIQSSVFVATTVSKATVDKAIYLQRFDVVIFDEASMAYVPQIVFSAGLAKSAFVCLGDFRQLPAIVQNKTDDRLSKDIFEYTGITNAVENKYGHEWLVMLNIQYRMHRDIADFVSKYMYNDLLKTSEKIEESREEIAACSPLSGSAMTMLDISGMYSVCAKTMDGSRINILSAMICVRLAEKYLDQFEVGIITPYSAQSRLILSMIRDLQDYDDRWLQVSCATVHQFQGSEKPVIIYDAVDCFRMPYPGVLLTSLKNDTANRLFNVALTRAKGKSILVVNDDFMRRKHISKNLIFTKALMRLRQEKQTLSGNGILDELMPQVGEKPYIFVEDRESSWEYFLNDVRASKKEIHIEMPDVIDDMDTAIEELINALDLKQKDKLSITIRTPEEIDLPEGLMRYVSNYQYVMNPITIIDKKLVWFGQPLYAADFISEGDILDTEFFPCIRMAGMHTARSLHAFIGI